MYKATGNSKSKTEDGSGAENSSLKSMENIPRFCRLIWQIEPKLTAVNILLRSLQAAIPVSILYAGKKIIDEVIRLDIEGSGSKRELFWNSEELFFWLIIALVLAISKNLLTRYTNLSDKLLGEWINNETSVGLMRQATGMDLQYFEDPAFYDNLTRARSNAGNRQTLISIILQQVQDTFTLAALLVALAVFSPLLIAVLIIVIIPAFLVEFHFNKKDYLLAQKWTPENREMDYLRYIATHDTVAKEVKVFGLERYLTDRFKNLATSYYHATKKIAIKRNIVGNIFNVLSTASYFSAYVFVIFQTVTGVITVGTMTFVAGAFRQMQGILQATVYRISRVISIGLYLKDYFDFMDLELPTKETDTLLATPTALQSELVFENVSFKYFGSKAYAIKNLSFVLKAGESLALVGENGAGKTTLVKLIARLYYPTEGRILWNGTDIQEYGYEAYRSKIGVIFQDFVKYMFTAKENISVGNISEKENQVLIEKSAKKALASVLIENLENKYDQMLGKRFSNGVELSGGQWQKIALARAYMRDADLVILDEPTAALDARAEHEVFLRFSELMNEKTAILISHRFSTVRMADRILFLEAGEILESGSHNQLLEKNGKYAELFKLQALGYT